MKKVLCFAAILALVGGSAWAAPAKPAAKSAPKPAAATYQSQPAASPVSAIDRQEISSLAAIAPERQPLAAKTMIDGMNPGLFYNFMVDLKLFALTNPTIVVPQNTNDTGDWFEYSTYRAVVGNVFNNGVAILADIEKPGYADVTYPTLKVNELYARFQQGSFFTKVGRQQIGDVDDLLLGLQADAVMVGFDLGSISLPAFIARAELSSPWGEDMDGMFGVVPDFRFGSTMGLKGYLLVNTHEIIVTPTTGTPHDVINMLITLGAKYDMSIPVGAAGSVDMSGQLGIETASARTATDQTVDATGVGLKLDGSFSSLPANAFGFKVGAHIVYTSGTDTTPPTANPPAAPKYGFASNNTLPGSGPGLFSKVQDGARPFTYLDSHSYSTQFQQYQGVMALGATGDFFIGPVQLGAGLWSLADTTRYSTNPQPTRAGVEVDQWAIFRISKVVSFYEQLGYFLPANNTPTGSIVKNPLKFVIGSSLTF